MPVVTRGDTSPRVVRVSQAVAAQISARQTRVATISDDRTAATVQDRTSVLNVASPGARGPAGADGVNGAGLIAPISFAWGDASPRAVYTLPDDALCDSAQLVIETAFNGAAPRIALGTLADPELLIPFTHNDPTRTGTYEASPDVVMLAGEVIRLTIEPGEGASIGAGRLLLTLNPL